jgi:5-methylcytosine-specific restriction endonuclease McrA
MREAVRSRKGCEDGCSVCGTLSDLQLHHIVPIAIGGRETKENKLTLCNACHKVITIYYAMIGLMDVKVEYGQRAKRM